MIKSGIIFLIVLVTASGYETTMPGFDFKDYKEMMHGFLLGIEIAEKYMDHLLSCLTDQKSLEVKFVEIMDKIDKLDFSNLPYTAELFADLYEVIIMSIVEIDLCSKDNDDYDKLFQKIYHLMPTTIIKRLMLNFISNPQQIFKDIQDAIDNYLGGKFRQVGQDIGDIMRMVLLYRVVKPLTLEEYIKLLKGLLTGLNVNADLEKVLKCVDKVPDAVERIVLVIQLLKKIDITNIEEVIDAIKNLITAVKEVLKELGVCAESVAEIKELIEKLSKIDLTKIIKQITKHVFEIIAAIMDAKKAWELEDYEKFGLKVGEVLYMILIKLNSEMA
jgi:hypothetical protein